MNIYQKKLINNNNNNNLINIPMENKNFKQ